MSKKKDQPTDKVKTAPKGQVSDQPKGKVKDPAKSVPAKAKKDSKDEKVVAAVEQPQAKPKKQPAKPKGKVKE